MSIKTGKIPASLITSSQDALGLAPLKLQGTEQLYDNSEYGRARHAQFMKYSEASRRGWATRRAQDSSLKEHALEYAIRNSPECIKDRIRK